MKKLVIVLAVIAMVFGMSSCTKKGGSTPTEAAKSYYELLKKGDFKGATQSTYDYNKEMSQDEKDAADAMIDMTAGKLEEAMNAKGGMKDFVLSNEVIDGENATVDVTITYGNGDEESKIANVKKVGDKWFMDDEKANVENTMTNAIEDALNEAIADEETEETVDEEDAE